MKNTRLGRRCAVRLASAAAALTAALILTMMTVAAATINATDVTIRNTAEDKSDYSNAIGVLQQGDKVTVLSKTTDGSGNEWFYVELENGNKGYVKAQWVDNGDAAVPEEETAQPEEPQEAEQEAETIVYGNMFSARKRITACAYLILEALDLPDSSCVDKVSQYDKDISYCHHYQEERILEEDAEVIWRSSVTRRTLHRRARLPQADGAPSPASC